MFIQMLSLDEATKLVEDTHKRMEEERVSRPPLINDLMDTSGST